MAHVMIETLDQWNEHNAEMNPVTARRLGESGAHRVLGRDKRTVYLVNGAVWRRVMPPSSEHTVGRYAVVRLERPGS